jgi:Lrp/AsnC family leucine-responsive transcriptional regulator
MTTLDMKDRKILYELDLDCRQTNTQIGKKVGLKKDVVSYRIKKLEDEGYIKNYYTVIDTYRIGYNLFRYYINFQYVTTELKKEIIDYFVNYKNICTVAHAAGKYDLIVVVWVKNLNEFHQFWTKALDKYGDYFEARIFSVYIYGIGFVQSYLLLDSYKQEERIELETFGVGDIKKIDEIDYYLLNELSLNARQSLIVLAKKFHCSSQTISYRMNRLKKEGIVQAYRVAIDLVKLGLKRYKVDIYLKEYKQRNNIIRYIKKCPFLIYISTSTGISDLEFEFVVENSEKLIEIVEDINTTFPNSVRSYNFYGDLKIYKETFLPKLY